MPKKPKERDCDHNHGVFCTRSDCNIRCAWNPEELERRRQIIADGKGLTVGKDGRKRLIIKREEKETDAD